MGGGIIRSEQFAQDLQSALSVRQIDERVAVRGQELLQSGPCHLRIFNPPAQSPDREGTRLPSGAFLNNHSIVSKLQCGQHSILFAADIEVDGLSRLPVDSRQPVTMLKVPHHGARSSLDQGWIHQLQPKYAIISVGAGNPYGHPGHSVLQTYTDLKIPIYRTDRDGAILVSGRLSTSEFIVTRMRDLIKEPVNLFTCPWRCEYANWNRLLLLAR